MSQAIPASTPEFRGKLARTMLSVLIPIALVPLLIMGGIVYARSRQILTNQIESTLISIEEQQQAKIDLWVEAREERINEFYIDPLTVDAFEVVSQQRNREDLDYLVARELILLNLERINSNTELIHQFFILSPDGEILVASNRQFEGTSLADTSYFKNLSTEHAFIAEYNPEPIYTSLAFFTARPYYTIDGEHLVTIWGMTGQSRFEALFNEIAFLGIRMYLITQDKSFVGIGPNIKADIDGPIFQPSTEQTQLFNSILTDPPGRVIEFMSFDNQEVLAAYLPLPDLQAGLVIEIPITTTINQLQNLPYLGALLALTILVSILLTWYGTRRIVKPVLEIADSVQHFSDGDWQRRAPVNSSDELGILAYSFNQMADELSSLYRSLETQVLTRTQQVRTASEVARMATSATDLETVLRQTVKLIVERFGHYYAAIYLLDEAKEYAVLKDFYNKASQSSVLLGYENLPVGDGSIIGKVSATNQYYVATDVEEDPFYLPIADLPDIRSEVVIPLSVGDNVIGILDVQSNRVNAFEADNIETLQTLANQISTVLQNFHLLESARVDLRATSALYQASHTVSEAETSEDVFQALANTLEQAPFISVLFVMEADGLVGMSIIDPIRGAESTQSKKKSTAKLPRISISTAELAGYFETPQPLIVTEDEQFQRFPNSLIDVPRSKGCQSFAFLPIMPDNEFMALLILGALDTSRLTQIAIEPYTSLIDITRTALEKVNALGDIQQRLVELETLSTVGQSISTETKLDTLYQIIHRQIVQVMGDVNFLIAHYNAKTDTIEIPYLNEGGQISTVPPFPLGEGLTSIIIRTQQPLMIVEDTVNRSRALGAKPSESGLAKSWLGVPLMVSNEPIGAIVVQDLENEHRFDKDDMRLLVTLASQVAIAIRNARLLDSTRERAEQQRKLFEITNKLRRSPDMQAILKITAQELSKALGAKRTQIRIDGDPELSEPILISDDSEEDAVA